MTRLIACAALIAISFACNGQIIKGIVKTDPKKSDSKSANSEKLKPAAPDSGDQAASPTDLNPNPSVTPSVIAGASLTCKPTAGGAECETRSSAEGSLVDVDPGKFYVIRHTDLKWEMTIATRHSPGVYEISTTLPSFAVGLINTGSAPVAKWVIPPPNNVLRNGSFEESPFEDGGWSTIAKPKSLVVSALTEPYCGFAPHLHIDAADGNHFVDLNGFCSDGKRRSGLELHQRYEAKVGHLYELVFSYSPNPLADVDQGFVSKWNETETSSTKIMKNDAVKWNEISATMLATDAEGYVSFMDNSSSDYGTLIDDVRLYDLGEPPAQP